MEYVFIINCSFDNSSMRKKEKEEKKIVYKCKSLYSVSSISYNLI